MEDLSLKYYVRNLTQEGRPKSILLKYIFTQIYKNDGHIIATITGGTGTGKSFCALKLCEAIDPYFNAERIVFNVKDYSKLMAKPFPRGSCFLLEEAQHAAHNLNYASQSNKSLFYLFSTFRHRNYVTILTLPNSNHFDKQSKSLVHIDIKTTGTIDHTNNRVRCNVFFPKMSDFKDKLYLNPLKFKSAAGTQKLRSVWIHKPSNGILATYQKRKHSFTKNLSKTLSMGLQESEIKKLQRITKTTSLNNSPITI